MKTNLNTYDRITLKKIFQERESQVGGLKGFTLEEARIAMKILDQIDFSDDEIKGINLKINNDTVSWDKSEDKEFSFSKQEIDLVKKIVSARMFWEIDKRNVEFAEKFEIKKPVTVEEENKSLNLNLFDRLFLRKCVFEQNGRIQRVKNLYASLEILLKIELGKEEIEKYNVKIDEKRTQWDSDEEKEFVFTNVEFTFLKECLEKNENVVLDKRIFELSDKFGIEFKEEPEEKELV